MVRSTTLRNLFRHRQFKMKLLDTTLPRTARNARALYAGGFSGAVRRGIDTSGRSCRIGFIAPSRVQTVHTGVTVATIWLVTGGRNMQTAVKSFRISSSSTKYIIQSHWSRWSSMVRCPWMRRKISRCRWWKREPKNWAREMCGQGIGGVAV